MNKRIIAFALLLVLIALLLCGCGRQMDTLGDGEHAATHFSVVDRYDGFWIIVDTDTGVMYAVSTGHDQSMTLLVDFDGSPRLFPGFDAKEDRYG